jgi:hypothetical protein
VIWHYDCGLFLRIQLGPGNDEDLCGLFHIAVDRLLQRMMFSMALWMGCVVYPVAPLQRNHQR